MNGWYAVQSRPRYEETAKNNLVRQGYDVFLPKYLKRRRHARRTDWIASPIFPRYLFVGLNLETEPWRAIQSTIGAVSLVCFSDKPTPVPDNVIDSLKNREDESGLISLRNIARVQIGDQVQVVRGALEDNIGVLESLDDLERVTLLLDLMGRQVRVKTRLDNIAATD